MLTLYCLLNYLPSSFFDFSSSHNSASAEVDLFLRDDLKDKVFSVEDVMLLIDIMVKRNY